MFFGRGDGAGWAEQLEDLADLFEQAAADATPIRAVVGEDPVAFAETFFRNYSDGQWINKERERSVTAIEREFYREIEREITKERERLVNAIERAEARDGGTGQRPDTRSATP